MEFPRAINVARGLADVTIGFDVNSWPSYANSYIYFFWQMIFRNIKWNISKSLIAVNAVYTNIDNNQMIKI